MRGKQERDVKEFYTYVRRKTLKCEQSFIGSE